MAGMEDEGDPLFFKKVRQGEDLAVRKADIEDGDIEVALPRGGQPLPHALNNDDRRPDDSGCGRQRGGDGGAGGER